MSEAGALAITWMRIQQWVAAAAPASYSLLRVSDDKSIPDGEAVKLPLAALEWFLLQGGAGLDSSAGVLAGMTPLSWSEAVHVTAAWKQIARQELQIAGIDRRECVVLATRGASCCLVMSTHHLQQEAVTFVDLADAYPSTTWPSLELFLLDCLAALAAGNSLCGRRSSVQDGWLDWVSAKQARRGEMSSWRRNAGELLSSELVADYGLVLFAFQRSNGQVAQLPSSFEDDLFTVSGDWIVLAVGDEPCSSIRIRLEDCQPSLPPVMQQVGRLQAVSLDADQRALVPWTLTAGASGPPLPLPVDATSLLLRAFVSGDQGEVRSQSWLLQVWARV